MVDDPNNNDSDDPFDMFGEDDDESDNDNNDIGNNGDTTPANYNDNTETLRILARSLVDSANKKNNIKAGNKAAAVPTVDADEKTAMKNDDDDDKKVSDNNNINDDNDELQAIQHQHVIPCYWREPLYMGPMKLIICLEEKYGGGRGYVASRNLQPGTLVLVEQPIIEWSNQQLGQELNLVSVKHILLSSSSNIQEAQRIIHEMEHLHPTKQIVDNDNEQQQGSIDSVDDEEQQHREQVTKMMKLMRSRYYPSENDDNDNIDNDESKDNQQKRQELDELVKLAADRGLQNSNHTPITVRDCLRLLLALRYNGLESGVYLHVAMFNHNDQQPNCVKFMPTTTTTTTTTNTNSNSSHKYYYSEVRTTRPVLKGESLTISYLPTILSYPSRRKHLWEQHRFDIGGGGGTTMLQQTMELVNGSLPSSSLHLDLSDRVTCRIERAIADLRHMYQEAEDEIITTEASAAAVSDSDEEQQQSAAAAEQLKALEQTVMGLCQQSNDQLKNPKHILLTPCYELHFEVANTLLAASSSSSQSQILLSSSQRMMLLSRLVVTSMRLLQLQKDLYGPDHYTLARTYLDLAQAIEELLSKSTKHLQQLNTNSSDDDLGLADSGNYSSVSAWSALVNKCRKEFTRIKNLYPQDAEEWIHRNSSSTSS